MANSKHAHLRYNILDYCFRNKSFTFNQLLAYVNVKIAECYPNEGVSERTLREDLKIFRDEKEGFGAPLPKKVRVLKYSDPNFSIAQKPLLPYEKELFEASQQLLERFEDDPKYHKFRVALNTFQDEQDSEFLLDYKKIIFGDNNEAYEGEKLFTPMFDAIKSKSVLKVTTSKFDGANKRSFIFHPHVLKQYNQRWFLFGFNAEEELYRYVIPLDDRFLSFEKAEDVIYKEDNTDWKNYFRKMVGPTHYSITNDTPLIEIIVLKFSENRLPYFKSKPIHPFWDEFNEAGKENQVFFEAIINRELVQQILSYGSDIEVLEPIGLKLEIEKQVKEMMKFYE